MQMAGGAGNAFAKYTGITRYFYILAAIYSIFHFST